MQKLTSVRLLTVAIALGLTILAIAGCDTSRTGEPEEAAPSPTTEAFTSSLLPTGTSLPPTATLPALIVDPGFGGAQGVIVTYPPSWDGQELFVYFAPFYPGEKEDEGIYVLEPSIHPVANVDPSGSFQIGNVPPGEYVLAVGSAPEQALMILDGNRQRIFEVIEGRILAVGQIHLDQ